MDLHFSVNVIKLLSHLYLKSNLNNFIEKTMVKFTQGLAPPLQISPLVQVRHVAVKLEESEYDWNWNSDQKDEEDGNKVDVVNGGNETVFVETETDPEPGPELEETMEIDNVPNYDNENYDDEAEKTETDPGPGPGLEETMEVDDEVEVVGVSFYVTGRIFGPCKYCYVVDACQTFSSCWCTVCCPACADEIMKRNGACPKCGCEVDDHFTREVEDEFIDQYVTIN